MAMLQHQHIYVQVALCFNDGGVVLFVFSCRLHYVSYLATLALLNFDLSMSKY